MAKDTFEEIHGSAGGAIQVGQNLGAAVVTAEAVAAAQGDGGGEGGCGADARALVAAPRLSSFSVYYDQSDKTLKIFEPKIIVPYGHLIELSAPNIGDGTYYCNVWVKRVELEASGASEWNFDAKIEDHEAVSQSGFDIAASVPLFSINGTSVKQYHTGVLVFGGYGGGSGKIKSVSGTDGIEVGNMLGPDVVVKSTCVMTIGSNANEDGKSQIVADNNHVAIVGDRWCGLEVVPNLHNELRVQLIGRNSIAGTDPFRIRKFIGSAPGGLEGTEVLFFGSADIELPTQKKYVAGDDTNIVFTEKEDSEGNATGEIAVDVYYK